MIFACAPVADEPIDGDRGVDWTPEGEETRGVDEERGVDETETPPNYDGVWSGEMGVLYRDYGDEFCVGAAEIEIVDGLASGFGACEMSEWGWGGDVEFRFDGEVVDGVLEGEVSFQPGWGRQHVAASGQIDGDALEMDFEWEFDYGWDVYKLDGWWQGAL